MSALSATRVFTRTALAVALLTGGLAVAQEQQAGNNDQKETEATDAVELAPVEVATTEGDVTGGSDTYAGGSTSLSTGLSLSPRQTPQSVSTITRAQIEDFGLYTVNDVLEQTTGVTVEQVETDRTYYTARGFEITNFLVDGIGIPFVYHNNVVGRIDTAIYDQVEVLRGANGLISGTGNPAATVNFVRKRPTAEYRAQADLTLGQWEKYRLDGDVSGPLNESGSVRGRFVAAYENRDSYLDRYHREDAIAYGVVSWDLTEATRLVLGHSFEQANADSPMWGALPLYRTDGTATDYDRSTSTSSDWSFWNNTYQDTFLEVHQELGASWNAQLTLEHRQTDSDSELFYVYGTPNPDTTGSDLFSYPSAYDKETKTDIADLRVKGPFELGGRMHEAMVGFDYWESGLEDESNYGQGIGTEIVPLERWEGDYPEPAFTAGTEGSDLSFRQKSAFGVTRFSITEPFAVIGGARVLSLDYSGQSYGVSRDVENQSKTVPYAGVVYDLTSTWSVYASHTEIFQPQNKVDEDRDYLDPIEGVSQEAGFKADFPGRNLNLSIAAFEIKQDNVGEQAGTFGNGDPYYQGRDGLTSRGYEIEMQGEVTDSLELSAGFTSFNVNGEDGERAKTYVPERTAHLTTAYRIPAFPRMKVGGSVNWQDDIYLFQDNASTGPNAGEPIHTRQDDYALVNLMGSYEITDQFTAQLNVNNVTNEKYINSLQWAQGYYGAPRHAELRLSWNF